MLSYFTGVFEEVSRERWVQVVRGGAGGAPADCWSLGVILAELALRRPLFPCHSPSQLLRQVF